MIDVKTIENLLQFELIHLGGYTLTAYNLLAVVALFFLTKLILWFIRKGLRRMSRYRGVDEGSEYAIFQMVKYVLWCVMIAMALETIGIRLTFLLAGSAALLVGIGLGIQQTFNDIISGIILLFEGSTRVGDILSMEDNIVRVLEIGLRTSKVIDRDDIIIFIPNSLIVTSKVVNWSHQYNLTRFRVTVGVAYGSDVDLVMRLLEESASEHSKVSKKRKPEARFLDFGNSSLDFEVLFWSPDLFRIDRVTSDIRITINKKFIENGITIPFPQRDLHFKSSDVKFS